MLSSINALFKNSSTQADDVLKINSKYGNDYPIEDGFPKPPSLVGSKASVDRNKNLSLVAYPDSNSLVVKGSPEQIRYVRQLVNALDDSRRQVELSLWFMDVVRVKLDDLGVRWESRNWDTGSGKVNFNRSTLTDSTKFLAQINAISKNDSARIVSRPVILTQENVPALFDNNTSFYARLQGERVVSLKKVTYSTMIIVLPIISASRRVEIEVNIEDGGLSRDSSGNTADVGGLPQVNRTSINTVARIAENSSLLIGGYTSDQAETNESRIPFLSDMPLLGNLFKF